MRNILENYYFKSISSCRGELFEFNLRMLSIFYSFFQLNMDWSISIICQKEDDSELQCPLNKSSCNAREICMTHF